MGATIFRDDHLREEWFVPEFGFITTDMVLQKAELYLQFEQDIPQIPYSIIIFDTTNKSTPTIDTIHYRYSLYSFEYDKSRTKTDSTKLHSSNFFDIIGEDFYSYNRRIRTDYSVFEFGRFITPYGINLSLGNDGFE